jgi:hypothetical protein
MSLTEDEFKVYKHNKVMLIDRVKKEFPSIDLARSKVQLKAFSGRLNEALSEHPTSVPYRFCIEAAFEESDADDYAGDAKKQFLTEVEHIAGPGMAVKSIIFEEIEDDDAAYNIVAQAPRSIHAKVLREMYGMDEDEIRKIVKQAEANGKTSGSIVEDFAVFVRDRQYQAFTESFEKAPESFDNQEPQRMSFRESIEFIEKSIEERSDDVLCMLAEFAQSSDMSQDAILKAIKGRRNKR